MKELFGIIGIIGLLIGSSYVEHNYTMDARVTKQYGDFILCEDPTGHIWAAEESGFERGQKVKISFYDNNTPTNRLDDIIIKIK